MNRKIEEFVLRESQGNAESVCKARAEYGMLRDGEATMELATKSQMEEYGDDLVGWCSRCEKPINGRWAGLVSFCPWCGRPMRWGTEE